MSDQASVQSFDAIQRVREELLKFGHRANDGLTELEGEIRRMIEWIEHDRPGYWKERVRRAYDAVTEAKNALHRALMYPINDEQPACSEERAALKKAEAALVYARDKQERVKRWAQTMRHELHEYQGRTAHLKQYIEIDVPGGAARLSRTLAVLEEYAKPTSIGSSNSTSSTSTSSSQDTPGEATVNQIDEENEANKPKSSPTDEVSQHETM